MHESSAPVPPADRAATRTATRWGGAALLAATVLFAAVFAYLAQAFGYPEVLDAPAAEVLPRLLALGPAGRAVWALYALVPWLLLPAALGVHAAGRQAAPLAARAAVLMAVLSAACMSAGLMRWPSLHWQLAQAHAQATPAAQDAIAAVFAGANSLLGVWVGEFLGELFLNAFFALATGVLLRSSQRPQRWLGWAGFGASALGALALLRNATDLVAPLAALNNAVLPLWMAVLGTVLLRHATSSGARPASAAGRSASVNPQTSAPAR